ncbi:hypothetical protein [Vibrio japonicus]|uniref:Cation transporter n=1 Tax=Vibrio japonicus TaxID=1824638 RepID=A0ABY5LIQ8_9VIBR|nr:hypothetical protein [Vibrio japonicus]UUM31696.1 hypothetical protein NP165_06055 [Vibrio japonicus]
MERDIFGICLSKSMLSRNLSGTFTHVRAYAKPDRDEDAKVMHAYPQLSGKEVLANMELSKSLFWRAEFACLELR